jgi:hypothetical protein
VRQRWALQQGQLPRGLAQGLALMRQHEPGNLGGSPPATGLRLSATALTADPRCRRRLKRRRTPSLRDSHPFRGVRLGRGGGPWAEAGFSDI